MNHEKVILGGFSHFSDLLKDRKEWFGICFPLEIWWCLHLLLSLRLTKFHRWGPWGSVLLLFFGENKDNEYPRRDVAKPGAWKVPHCLEKWLFFPSKSVMFIRFCVTKPGLVAHCWPPAACVWKHIWGVTLHVWDWDISYLGKVLKIFAPTFEAVLQYLP